MTARLYFRLCFLLYLTFREFAVILILQKGFTCEGAMEGIFKRSIKEYIWAGILAFVGVVCTASFSVIMILALAEHEAASGDLAIFATFIVLSFICIIFGIGNILSKSGEYIKIENGRISAKSSFGKRLECGLDDVEFAMCGDYMRRELAVKANGKRYDFSCLENAHRLALYLSSPKRNKRQDKNREELLKSYDRANYRLKLHATAMVLSVIVFIVITIACSATTVGKDGGEFASKAWICFAIFMVSLVGMFATVMLCNTLIKSDDLERCIAVDGLRNSTFYNTPLLSCNIVNVYRDENMCRICISKVATGEFYYTIEEMSTASDNRFSLATAHRSEFFPDRESLVRSFGKSTAMLSDVTENFKLNQ